MALSYYAGASARPGVPWPARDMEECQKTVCVRPDAPMETEQQAYSDHSCLSPRKAILAMKQSSSDIAEDDGGNTLTYI